MVLLVLEIKGVSTNMTSAKLYLSANVVDRLTKPTLTDQKRSPNDKNTLRMQAFDDDDMMRSRLNQSNVMDVASFMGSLGGNMPYNTPGNRSASRPSSAPRERRSNSIGDMSINSNMSGSTMSLHQQQEKQAKVQKFKEFMSRQTQSVKRKDHHIQDVSDVI